jgi:hypothetical protein
MKLHKLALYSFGCLVLVAVVAAITSPKLSAAVRAALTEVVIPSRPFNDTMQHVLNLSKSIGPDVGTLGGSNITLINYDSAAQQVFIFAPVFSTGGCGGEGSTVIRSSGPEVTVYVQPHQTLTLPYPSPLVFSPVDGHTCVAAIVQTQLNGGSVLVSVTGFVN